MDDRVAGAGLISEEAVFQPLSELSENVITDLLGQTHKALDLIRAWDLRVFNHCWVWNLVLLLSFSLLLFDFLEKLVHLGGQTQAIFLRLLLLDGGDLSLNLGHHCLHLLHLLFNLTCLLSQFELLRFQFSLGDFSFCLFNFNRLGVLLGLIRISLPCHCRLNLNLLLLLGSHLVPDSAFSGNGFESLLGLLARAGEAGGVVEFSVAVQLGQVLPQDR